MSMRKIVSLCAVLVAGMLWTESAMAQDKVKVDHGIKVYAATKCSVCHSIAGKGSKKGPLDGVASKLSEEEIRQWLVNAPEMTKKTKSTRKPFMKNYAHLPKDDVDALVAYMMTLKKG